VTNRLVARLLQACACCVTSALLTFSAPASAALDTALAVAGMRSVASSLIDKGTSSGELLVAELGREANKIADRVERMLGENIRRPLSELDSTMRNEVTAARQAIDSLQATANSLPACLGNEAEILVANIKSGLASTLQGVPLLGGPPIAYLVQQPTTRSPFTVVRPSSGRSPIHVILRGANLWTKDDICEIQAEALPIATAAANSTRVDVRSIDAEKADLALPHTIQEGTWLMSLSAKVRRPIVGCSAPKTEQVTASFFVREPLQFKVEAELTPVCKQVDRYTQPFEGSCTNGSHSEKKTCTSPLQFQKPGYRLESYTFETTTSRRASVSHERSGDDVLVIAKAEKKKPGKGDSKVAWRVTMTGARDLASTPGASIRAPINDVLAPGSSVAFSIELDKRANCEVSAWALSGKATDERSTSIAIPQARSNSSDADVRTFANGIMLEFSGLTKRGNIRVSKSSCLPS
jgi:hypothetical protein